LQQLIDKAVDKAVAPLKVKIGNLEDEVQMLQKNQSFFDAKCQELKAKVEKNKQCAAEKSDTDYLHYEIRKLYNS